MITSQVLSVPDISCDTFAARTVTVEFDEAAISGDAAIEEQGYQVAPER